MPTCEECGNVDLTTSIERGSGQCRFCALKRARQLAAQARGGRIQPPPYLPGSAQSAELEDAAGTLVALARAQQAERATLWGRFTWWLGRVFR